MKTLILFFAFLTFAGCNTKLSDPNLNTRLVGRWVSQTINGQQVYFDFVGRYVSSITFNADGSFFTNATSTDPGFKTGEWSLPNDRNIIFDANYTANAATNFSSKQTEPISFNSKGDLLLTITPIPGTGGQTVVLTRAIN